MAEIEGAIGRQFQSLSIVFVCAVNTKLASLFRLEFSLKIYMELTEYFILLLHILCQHVRQPFLCFLYTKRVLHPIYLLYGWELFMHYFVCVAVMYSGEYDVCDVTLSVHPHRAS
jgi:hypothetical protein